MGRDYTANCRAPLYPDGADGLLALGKLAEGMYYLTVSFVTAKRQERAH